MKIAFKVLKFKAIALLIVLLFSCDDNFLNKYPLDSPSTETFYSNEKELIMGINACYKNLVTETANWGNFNSRMFPWHLETTTDIAWERYGSDVGIGIHDSQSGYPRTQWNRMFNGIAKCNSLLSNMDKGKENTNEEVFNRIKAEAKFLRAYFYHHLIELYGDVPLLEETPPLEEPNVSRTEKSVIVDFILNEFEEASIDLPIEYSGSDKGRITKGAALTYKARTALYNEKWDIAIDATQRVMNLGVYSLYPNYEKLFHYEGENCDEIILDFQFKKPTNFHSYTLDMSPDNGVASSWNYVIPLQDLIDSYEAIDGKPIDESPIYDQSNPFKNRDPRLRQSIFYDGMRFGTWNIYTHPDSIYTWQFREGGDSIRVQNTNVTSAYGSFSGYHWKKYVDEIDAYENPYESEINLILSRYAEVLLMYAEAKIEKNNIDQTVLDAINQVRQRPNVNMPEITTTNQIELRKIVRRERKVELAFEGLRLYDIRRWKIAEKALNRPVFGRPKGSYDIINVPDIDEDGIPHYGSDENNLRIITDRSFNPNRDYLWPIPQAEMDVNPNLKQNPGY
ncbi:RagB/SusD family nutrient uptake outer membrane protein [Mariniphaga sp.]|uniref:RagB/SusD family nutrient uptake outer membrane protein n=1 Tax=Mariniphaga sp. TaxID=1954475 RepID=UPI003568F529